MDNEQLKTNLFEFENLLAEQDFLLEITDDLCEYYSHDSHEALKIQHLLNKCKSKQKLIQNNFSEKIFFDTIESFTSF